jgi:hypothetical protein
MGESVITVLTPSTQGFEASSEAAASSRLSYAGSSPLVPENYSGQVRLMSLAMAAHGTTEIPPPAASHTDSARGLGPVLNDQLPPRPEIQSGQARALDPALAAHEPLQVPNLPSVYNSNVVSFYAGEHYAFALR